VATLNQKVRWDSNIYYHKWRRPKLEHGPQRRGIVKALKICTPRKPNSARRKIVKAQLFTKRCVLAYIPGSGHNLRKFSKVLISGGGARDLPVVNFTCIRGTMGLVGLLGKQRRRSVYGMHKSEDLRAHVRRIYRKKLMGFNYEYVAIT
jgi:small subunit ribosomal protein S12